MAASDITWFKPSVCTEGDAGLQAGHSGVPEPTRPESAGEPSVFSTLLPPPSALAPAVLHPRGRAWLGGTGSLGAGAGLAWGRGL